MPIRFRIPTDEDMEAIASFDARAFGSAFADGELERTKAVLPIDRFWIAEDEVTLPAAGTDDARDIVGVATSYPFELTLPGNTQVACAGVSWVAVATTHRRQGILRQLMGHLDAGAAERGEPVMALSATEGGIYRRFGYGPATTQRAIEMHRSQIQFRSELVEPRTDVRIVGPVTGIEAELAERWNRAQRGRPGELGRTEAWFTRQLGDRANLTVALHADGHAIWKVHPSWQPDGFPQHRLEVTDLCAVTPQAHAALWQAIASVDLIATIDSRLGVTPDDALPHLLTDPRAVRTTSARDHLWVKVLDVPAAFSARSYRSDDRLVIATPLGTFEVRGDGPTRTTTDDPDLTGGDDVLGPLLLGGVSAGELARGRRLEGSPDAVTRADVLFGIDPVPHCATDF